MPSGPTPVLGVDVGGTKVAAGVVTDDGEVHGLTRAPTPTGDAETVFAACVAVCRDAIDAAGRRPGAVGIACGGPMTWPDGRVSPLAIHGWRGFPLAARLATALGLGVRIHNDAIAVAIAEHAWGAGRGTTNLLGMVVSTGVGGGLVLGGRVHDGTTGNAGHIGHVVVDPDGPPCACGGVGCVEAIASGTAAVRWAREQGWTGPDGAALAADATAGVDVAVRAVARAGDALGTGIASAAALLDLDRVVIGGGFSQAGPPLWEPLHAALARHAGLDFARVDVVPAGLGQHAGIAGAAALWLRGDRYWSPPRATGGDVSCA